MEWFREKTFSICPVCGKRLPAERVNRPEGVFLEKNCPEHGFFSAVLWRHRRDWKEWRGEIPPLGEAEALNCGECRGLCREHERGTCCTLLEVTGRCNMNCTFCFAGECREQDPSLEQVKAWIFDLSMPGQTFLQLSGGEPTVREDLPEIIAFAKKCGCRYIQLNTNGIRLAEEEGYAERLAAAGLSFVFLQFDGVTEDVFRRLRGHPMLGCKERAVEACGRAGLGVTLVPVIVPGVNENQIGEIIRCAVRRSPVVRGVHFQPVSYFGRIPKIPEDGDRFTLDQLLEAVEQQSDGLIRRDSLVPSCCDHPLCGFHGDFVVLPDGSLMPLTRRRETCCGPAGIPADPAEKNREFIGRRWERKDLSGQDGPEEKPDLSDMDAFLDRVRNYGFTLTSMDFQDAGNLDFERLRRCSLHVYRRGRWIPFCAAYGTWGEEWQRKDRREEKL